MLELVVAIFLLYTAMRLYVSFMQAGFIAEEKHNKPVLLSPGSYVKAANYAIAKEKLEIASAFLDLALFLFWVFAGFAWLQSITGIDGLLADTPFVMGFVAFNYILSLPFDIYKTFKLDAQYGFNNTTPKLFIKDQLKSAAMFLIFGGAVIYGLSWIIATFDLWWVYGFVFVFALVVLINLIYPTLIAPMFNKFTPLESSQLKDAIESMMQDVGFQSSGIFVQDSSKRDSRLNAYFGGLGKSKRVVLFDTLIKKLEKQELLAVLGHELGHFKNGDLMKNIVLMGVMIFVVFAIFGNLPTDIFTAMGVVQTPGVVIALIMLLVNVISFVFMPLISLASRKNEYAADRFGSDLVEKQALIDALLKLVEENKAFPKSHDLHIFFYHSHPPIIKRLEALGYDEHK
ncbi:MAG: M48 family metallopeptidase [Campylobacterota bacterium]